jgi:acetyl esterase/lipase
MNPLVIDPAIPRRRVLLAEAEHPRCQMVWIHGGGLEEGVVEICHPLHPLLATAGCQVVSLDYRLYPQVGFPAALEDGAFGLDWAMTRFPGLPTFIAGHSAGAWIAAMLALDPRYLAACGRRPQQLAGCIVVSGQMLSHHRVCRERDLPQPQIDEAAPLRHAQAEAPPWLAVSAEDDMPFRIEENALFCAILRERGHRDVRCQVIPGRDHGSVIDCRGGADDPLLRLMRGFIEDQLPR